jgi:hypothetical protein
MKDRYQNRIGILQGRHGPLIRPALHRPKGQPRTSPGWGLADRSGGLYQLTASAKLPSASRRSRRQHFFEASAGALNPASKEGGA